MARPARSGKAPSQRQLRVGELVRHAVADVLMRGELREPELQSASITVTEARMSPDLKWATIYIVPLGGAHAADILGALARARRFLRARVAAAVDLKFAPDLRFALDTSFDEARRIDTILRSPDVARDLAHRPDDEGEAGGGA